MLLELLLPVEDEPLLPLSAELSERRMIRRRGSAPPVFLLFLAFIRAAGGGGGIFLGGKVEGGELGGAVGGLKLGGGPGGLKFGGAWPTTGIGLSSALARVSSSIRLPVFTVMLSLPSSKRTIE